MDTFDSKTIQELANNEFDNISKIFKEDSDIIDNIKDKKEIEVIKGRPTEKTKQEIKVSTSSSSQVTMRWDDKISGYKVCYSLSIEFKQ